MTTKEELIKKAEDIHYALLEIEQDCDIRGDENLPDEHFDLTLDLAYLMRDFLNSNFHKTYHYMPGVIDFYSGKSGEVEVDPDIAEAVKIFNEKGYKTFASCSGHVVDLKAAGTARGYVWIEFKPINPLPRGLFFYEKSIRWHPRTERGLKKAQQSILKYACALPDLLAQPK